MNFAFLQKLLLSVNVTLSVLIYHCLSVSLSLYLSVYLALGLSVYLSICLSVLMHFAWRKGKLSLVAKIGRFPY